MAFTLTLRRFAFNETQARSLVLNSSYEPIKIVNWQKAILLWLTNKVEVLEFHATQKVRSAHDSFKLPSVLRLHRYIHKKHFQGIRFCRENVYLRDEYRCQYCGESFSYKKLTLDHVLPLSRSGAHSWGNVVAACSPCNNLKADKTPKEARMPLLNKPHKPKFLPIKVLDKNQHSILQEWGPYISGWG